MGFRLGFCGAGLAVLLCAAPRVAAQVAEAKAACETLAGEGATYVQVDPAQLKRAVPALRGLKDRGLAARATCANVLDRTGETLEAMLARIPDLVAEEFLVQRVVGLPYTIQGDGTDQSLSYGGFSTPLGTRPDGAELEEILHSSLATQGTRMTYNYRIRPGDSGRQTGGHHLLTEFRTDMNNQEMEPGPVGPRWQGFAAAWMMFVPAHWEESRFRLLGEQEIDGRNTYVVAFAQMPERVEMPGTIRSWQGKAGALFLQGVAWIDADSFAVVRLQTDLLAPVQAVHLERLRSSIEFQEVKIPERELTLWLPKKVDVAWQFKGDQAGVETHTYSRYRLFAVSSRIVAAQ